MAFQSVFQYPTIKQVVFQVRYPTLFYLDNKIGDIQIKLMERFPKSSILTRRQMIVANYSSDVKSIDLDNVKNDDEIQKIWQFKDEHDTTVNILNDSIDISSTSHKTFNNSTSDYKFRDVIKVVIDSFIEIMKVPVFSRMGLRYIDSCPIDSLNNSRIQQLYNSVFPFNRFNLEESEGTAFQTTVKKGAAYLRYAESFIKENDKDILSLDFDGFSLNLKSSEYLEKLDLLHEIVGQEFENSIKDPIIQYMNTGEL